MMKCPAPLLFVPRVLVTFPAKLFTSWYSTAATYRSSVKPVGVSPMGPHQSGDKALIVTVGVDTIKSGCPIFQSVPSENVSDGGMSAGFPIGAPLSAHVAILAISASLKEGSFLYFWMPMFFSMYHGGITPALVPSPVLVFMPRAQGRTSS